MEGIKQLCTAKSCTATDRARWRKSTRQDRLRRATRRAQGRSANQWRGSKEQQRLPQHDSQQGSQGGREPQRQNGGIMAGSYDMHHGVTFCFETGWTDSIRHCITGVLDSYAFNEGSRCMMRKE